MLFCSPKQKKSLHQSLLLEVLLAFELGFETPVGDFPFLKLHKSCPSVHLEECSGWKMKICEVFVAENAEVCPSIQGPLVMLRQGDMRS